jgi:DNA (cytosine-5)-methyltransferase 1
VEVSAYYNENDPFAAAWLRELIKAGLIADGEVDERDIRDVRAEDVRGFTQCHFFAGIGGWSYALRLAGWADDRACWTGSCPCGPWSVAGKGLGADDPRDLWPTWLRLIEQCGVNPIFGEQVESPAGRAWLDRVCADLEARGYAVGPVGLPAACVGAPQGRKRFWFVADTDDARRQGPERPRQPIEACEEWPDARREPLRSTGGHWPPGPGEVHAIPLLANGLPGVMGACKGYGNAIVPAVAAEFVSAYLDVLSGDA